MTTYRVSDRLVEAGSAEADAVFGEIYGTKIRPLCICRPDGIEMYLARVAGKLVVKRMPNTGGDHAPTCDSYEPPPELSGAGEVMGTAIQENADDGITTIKFDFSLTKVAGRAAPAPGGAETDSVKTDGSKLSLRGTLHYLWEEAGFNRWAPAMDGKRSWFVIRKYLIQAAENKSVKGSTLAEILYIPESFRPEKKGEIAQRRHALMQRAAGTTKGTRHLMLVIGEIKEIGASRYGHKITLMNVPDCDFMVNDDLFQRMNKRFANELALWDALKVSHLMVVGTVSVGPTGLPSFEELALMVVTENWIPFENTFDKIVIDAMTHSHRRFVKGLRYNLPSTRPLACLIAADTQPQPTAMYILPIGATEDYSSATMTLMNESKLGKWLWTASQSEMPKLPSTWLPE